MPGAGDRAQACKVRGRTAHDSPIPKALAPCSITNVVCCLSTTGNQDYRLPAARLEPHLYFYQLEEGPDLEGGGVGAYKARCAHA